MENNQSIIEIFNEFAQKTNRKIYTSERAYPSSFLYGVTNHKRIIVIPNTQEELSFLIGYHDPKSFSANELYFGSFIPLSMPDSVKLSIRKKYFFDSISPFKKQMIKLNNKIFDSSAIISGNDESIVSKYFYDYKVQESVLDSLNLMKDICIGINEINIEYVPAFKNKSNLGIFTRLKWLTDEELLEALFEKIESINASFLRIAQ